MNILSLAVAIVVAAFYGKRFVSWLSSARRIEAWRPSKIFMCHYCGNTSQAIVLRGYSDKYICPRCEEPIGAIDFSTMKMV